MSNFCFLETEEGIFEAVLGGKLDLQSAPWPSISTLAKDLVGRMLMSNPKKRITAADALGECIDVFNSPIYMHAALLSLPLL